MFHERFLKIRWLLGRRPWNPLKCIIHHRKLLLQWLAKIREIFQIFKEKFLRICQKHKNLFKMFHFCHKNFEIFLRIWRLPSPHPRNAAWKPFAPKVFHPKIHDISLRYLILIYPMVNIIFRTINEISLFDVLQTRLTISFSSGKYHIQLSGHYRIEMTKLKHFMKRYYRHLLA